ncbi:sterol 3-beta-glucosyltransferase [Diutina catenulata]
MANQTTRHASAATNASTADRPKATTPSDPPDPTSSPRVSASRDAPTTSPASQRSRCVDTLRFQKMLGRLALEEEEHQHHHHHHRRHRQHSISTHDSDNTFHTGRTHHSGPTHDANETATLDDRSVSSSPEPPSPRGNFFQKLCQVIDGAAGPQMMEQIHNKLHPVGDDDDDSEDSDDFASSENQGNFLMNLMTSANIFSDKKDSHNSHNSHHGHSHSHDDSGSHNTSHSSGRSKDPAIDNKLTADGAAPLSKEAEEAQGPLHRVPLDPQTLKQEYSALHPDHEPTKPGEAPKGPSPSPSHTQLENLSHLQPPEKVDSSPPSVDHWPVPLEFRGDPTEYRQLWENTKIPDQLTPLQESFVNNFCPSYLSTQNLCDVLAEKVPGVTTSETKLKIQLSIADKIQRVANLTSDDRIVLNQSAWLVKDVLLQGHTYLTEDALIYFAFMPKRSAVTASGEITTAELDSVVEMQQGPLGMRVAKYGETMLSSFATHRYWGVLRLETLSIYSSPTDLYFPRVIIDLRSIKRVEILSQERTPGTSSRIRTPGDGIFSPKSWLRSESASVTTSEDESSDSDFDDIALAAGEDAQETLGEGVWIKLTSKKKSYKLHCDNMSSARQWCNNIVKMCFRLNNANDAEEVVVKIPFVNILSVKRNALMVEDSGDPDEPTNLVVQYVATDGKHHHDDPNAENQKKKFRQRDVHVETFGLIFFRESSDFLDKFKEFLALKQDQSDDESENDEDRKRDRFYRRARRLVTKDDVRHYAPTLSTLQPMTRDNYILDQLETVNAHIKDQEYTVDHQLFPLHNKPGKFSKWGAKLKHALEGNSSHSGGATSPPKLSITRSKSRDGSLGGTTAASSSYGIDEVMSKSPSGMRSPSSGSRTPGSGAVSPVGSSSLKGAFSPSCHKASSRERANSSGRETPPEGDTVHFPRPLNLRSLRKIQMTFETTLKDPTKIPLLMNTGWTPPTPQGLDASDYDPSAKNHHKRNRIKSSIKLLSGVHNLITSNPSHYNPISSDDPYYVTDDNEREKSQQHFQRHFSLSPSYQLLASYYVYIKKGNLPVYGKLYLGVTELTFRSMLPGVSTKMYVPLNRIETVSAMSYSWSLSTYGMTVHLSGARKFEFEFGSAKARDDGYNMVMMQLDQIHHNEQWAPKDSDWGPNTHTRKGMSRVSSVSSSRLAQEKSDFFNALADISRSRVKLYEDRLAGVSGINLPFLLEDSPLFRTEVRPSRPLNITFLTIGSRGDVQPYIALGKGLINEGHRVTIATHAEFGPWIREHKIRFREIAGDPSELMELMVSHGSMSVSFLKDAKAKFTDWLKELLVTAWQACKGCDLLIESPSAMAGIHIAEALGVPYMRAFTMPWTRTRAYPQAFMVPDQKKGGSYNYMTHVLFETVFWKGMNTQVNKWRVNELNLPRTNLYRMQQNTVPFLYNVSPSILPPAIDFPDWVKVTGYWFLDEGNDDYEPPKELVEFIARAREDDKPLVYIGFGSIVVKDAKKMTEAVVEAVQIAGVRCILNKGWSDRGLGDGDAKEPELELPEDVYNSGSVPHDWLFPQMDAAVHHGGSGTTGATLKAGIPTIIKPFFGDQFFYGLRVEDMGVGLSLKKLSAKSLSEAIIQATTDTTMIEKANKVSENIGREFGVMTAISCIYSQMEYARGLIAVKVAHGENYKKHTPNWRDEESEWDSSDEELIEEAEEEATEIQITEAHQHAQAAVA